MTIERLRPLFLILAVALALWVGQNLRDRWQIGFSAELLRDWVDGFGWKAPVVYLAILVFRPFLLLPTIVLLPAGGASFGIALGTALGAAGMTLAALIQFWLAQGIGRERVQRLFGPSLARARRRIEAAGPLVVGAVTAHPTGPMTAFHWGAALASLPLVPFAAAVLAGAFTRSFLYSLFGASLDDPASPRFWAAAALLLTFFFLPIAHPAVRERLLGRAANAAASPEES